MLIGIGVLLLLPLVEQHMEHRHVGFEADYEKVVVFERDGHRTESRELSRLYRDSRGRMRTETDAVSEGGRTLRIAFILDPQKGRAVVIDIATGQPLPRRPRPPAGGPTGTPSPTPAAVSPTASEAPTRE